MTIAAAFHDQAGHCEALGSPFMGRLMRLIGDNWPLDRALAGRVEAWPGDIGPKGASIPLRLAGGLYALVLKGADPALVAAYPPSQVPDAQLLAAVQGALLTHAEFMDQWMDSAPQTNELRRSAGLIAAAHWLTARHKLPLHLSELGASAGLNLNFDRYALDIGGDTFGPGNPALTLTPDWQGPRPPVADVRVSARRGVDLNPLDPADETDALRLIAYLWADQPDRLSRTRAALACPPAPVDTGDAIDWLQTRLAQPWDGQLHMIFHTIAWQYFPAEAQERGKAMIEAAGAQATDAAPLAWVGMEADGTDAPGAALHLRLWPGDLHVDLGRICFHGRWVHWGPSVRT